MSERLMEVLLLAGFAVFLFLFLLFFLFVIAVFLDPGSYFYVPDLIDDFVEKHFGNKTNGDWIRSMTNEELANFLATDAVIACVHCKDDLHICSGDDPCEKCHQASVFWNWLGEEWKGSRLKYG